MGGGSKLIAYLALSCVLLFSACNHGKGSGIEDKPNGDENKKPTLKTFTINGENAMGGSVAFNGQSVTFQKEDVVIIFKEIGQQKDFTCSKEFPITIEAGKSETLIFKTQKKDNYMAQDLKVIVTCTNLELLKESLITVHGKTVENYSVELSEEKAKIETTNVKVQFAQSDAPEATFEGLPITLEGGKTYTFKIKTQETAKYASFDKTITVTCTKKDVPTELHLKKITVHGEEAKDGLFLISREHITITKENIKIYFEEAEAPKEVECEPETLTLSDAEQNLKIFTKATTKYQKFEKTIKVKHQEKKELHFKTLTIHGRNAMDGSVLIKKESVTENDVKFAFIETLEAPTTIKLEPQPFTLNYEEVKTLTISTAETAKYKALNKQIQVKREKDPSAPKDIDDAIEALKSQLTWNNSIVDADIALLTTIEGFAGSSITWESLDGEHCDLSGHIKRDIIDVKVQFKATVLWNGNTKNITFSTTIKRIEKIEKIKNDPRIGEVMVTWDFSEEGFLRHSVNGQATHLWEISNVDVKKKELTASLKKKTPKGGSELLELEEYIEFYKRENKKSLEIYFGASYIALKKKSVITWQEFKAYYETIHGAGKEDEKIFDGLKRYPYFISYSGTFVEFSSLSDAEKTNIIKEVLNNMKKEFCDELGISKDIADEELVEKLMEKVIIDLKIAVNNTRQNWKCRYTLDINIEIIYDKEKKWCEQMGYYDFYNTATHEDVSIYCSKINENEVNITLIINKPNAVTLFAGKCLISQSDSFTLKNKKDESKELQCSVTDVKDGEFTLTTTGSIEATFEMNFRGKLIEDLLY